MILDAFSMTFVARIRHSAFSRARSVPLVALAAPIVLAALLSGCASHRYAAPPATLPAPAAAETAERTADLRIAEAALEAGDTQLAISLFQKMLKTAPDSATAQLGLADAIYATGDVARAGVLYAGVEARRPNDPRAQLGLARVALRERRIEEAEARYRRLVADHPDSAVAAEGLGTTLDVQGKHDQAQAVYRAALVRHPAVHGLKVNLGLSLILAGNPREGANVLLHIAGLPDAPPQARQNLALAYGLLGNDEAAKRILSAENLPADSVEDGLTFYRSLRAHLGKQPARGPAAVPVAPLAAPPISGNGSFQ